MKTNLEINRAALDEMYNLIKVPVNQRAVSFTELALLLKLLPKDDNYVYFTGFETHHNGESWLHVMPSMRNMQRIYDHVLQSAPSQMLEALTHLRDFQNKTMMATKFILDTYEVLNPTPKES